MNFMIFQEKERLKEEKRRAKKLVKERKLVSISLKNAGSNLLSWSLVLFNLPAVLANELCSFLH